MRTQGRPAQAFPGNRFTLGKIHRNHHGVGRFLVVVMTVATSAGGNTRGILNVQAPTGDIDAMDSIVAQFAVTPMPEPMPIVMEIIVAIRTAGRWSLP